MSYFSDTECFDPRDPRPAVKKPEPMIAVIGRITVTTVMYNGSVLQRQGATLWYRLNPTANAWEALSNHGEIEQHYQKELRTTDGKTK